MPANRNERPVQIMIFSAPNAGTASTMKPKKIVIIAITNIQPQSFAPYDFMSKAIPKAEKPLNNNQNPSTNGRTDIVIAG